MNTLERTIKNIRPPDEESMEKARRRQAALTKPRGSLGLLEDISIKLAGIRADPFPAVHHKVIITMAADHGVVKEGISLYPQEVTRQMVFNFLNGGAAINILARQTDSRLIIVDMGVIGGFPPAPGLVCRMIDFGTQNMCLGPAMTRKQAMDCLESGIEVVETEIERGLDIIGTGDMGIGNTTAASAIIASLTGESVSNVTGRGTGIDDHQLVHKIEVIEKALQVNQPDPYDAMDVLAKVGGFEIGGLAGLMLAGAAHRIPVVIDGFISGAAALIATKLCPPVRDYLIASHLSAENGHSVCLYSIGLNPMLNLNMRLGEGTGSALGIFLVQSAANILTQMATFESANVTDIAAIISEQG